MDRVWRWVSVWLMVAVLPFKAVAGVGLIGCVPHLAEAGAPVVSDAQAGVGRQAVDRHAHSTKASHALVAEHDHEAHRSVSDDGARDLAEPSSSPAGTGAVKCSSCSPCCAAVAPPFAAQSLPAVLSGSPPANRAADVFPDVVTDVPHRPPRT